MSERYELIFGFVHCRGRTTYCAGYTESKDEAEAWVRDHRAELAAKMKIPSEDPVRYCRAAWCPLKKQKPWFDMVIKSDG